MKAIVSVFATHGLLVSGILLAGAASLPADDKDTGKPDAGALAVCVQDGAQHLIYRDAAGDVRQYSRPQGAGAAWTPDNLTAAAMAPKAAGNPAGYIFGTAQHVVYRGADDQVHELYFSPKEKKWNHANITTGAKAPKAAGDPAGYVLGDTQHVVYRGPEGEVIELFNTEGGKGWNQTNLTASAMAPRAAGNPTGYILKDNLIARSKNTQHVIYRGVDDQVHELYFSAKEAKWLHTNLTAATKATKAAGNPAGYVFDNTQHVVYRGVDDQVHELYFSPKEAKWLHSNLTGETKVTKAAGNPAGYILEDNLVARSKNTQHVVYRGADDQVYELYFSPKEAKWQSTNLTAAAKAPMAAGDPAGYALKNTQHVVYRVAGGDIVELSNQGGGSWRLNTLPVGTKSAGTSKP
jgi:catechol 2,3-dioxygenase-like lactoylglutathione lyase family enzyme